MKLRASDPGFSYVDDLWRLYALSMNPSCWFGITNDPVMDEIDEIRATLHSTMQDVLDSGDAIWLELLVRSSSDFDDNSVLSHQDG